MCIRDSSSISINLGNVAFCQGDSATLDAGYSGMTYSWTNGCLLYTSDAADERSSVDLGGRRIIKKKTPVDARW